MKLGLIKLDLSKVGQPTNVEKRDLLKKLAKLCGLSFFTNISTIEADLEEHVKELMESNLGSHHVIDLREDGVRAGDEITIYDSKSRTMYHTAFSRLSRNEIDSMIRFWKKIEPKSKYRGMRLLPLSVEDIQKAMDKANLAKQGLMSKSSNDHTPASRRFS